MTTMTSVDLYGTVDGMLGVAGHRIRVRVRGTGRPLLLVNGLGAPLAVWRRLEDRLDGVRTIAYDAPGSGASHTPRLPLSVPGHARLALGLLDTLGYGRASVLGFSFGGLVAQEMARRAGSRVDRLVLAATSCGWGGWPGDPAALLAVVAQDAEVPHRPGPAAARRGSDPLGSLYQLWAAATWTSAPWLASIRQPTLVLTGDRDRVVPPGNAHILAALLPDAHLRVIRGGDHLCLLDRADEAAPVLLDFLRR